MRRVCLDGPWQGQPLNEDLDRPVIQIFTHRWPGLDGVGTADFMAPSEQLLGEYRPHLTDPTFVWHEANNAVDTP